MRLVIEKPGTDPHGRAGFAPVKSADRVLQILEVLGSSAGPQQLTELARELSIPKSSLHGILETLRHRGWVELDKLTGRYALGIRSMHLASSYLDSPGVLQRAGSTLDWLNAATEETVQFGRLDGYEVVYLAKRQSRHPVQLISDVGKRLPANATALGKAILAEYPDEELEVMLAESLPRLTTRTLATRSELLADLARVRERGYAVDNEEAIDEIYCFAIALRQRSIPTTDAISVSIPKFRATDSTLRNITELLLEARTRLEV
ncbi:IclR family transcriptional regulator [Arthrobacter sp. GCM10027362]